MERKKVMKNPSATESQQVWKSVKTLFSNKIRSFRHGIAHSVVNNLYGREMSISPFSAGAVSACVVFWYMDGGIRKFIFIREQSSKKHARFISVMKNNDEQQVNETLLHAINRTLGHVFFKSLDRKLFDIDRVAATPSFVIQDNEIKENIQMLSLVWVVQITKEQAQLCNGSVKNFEVVTIPEFSLVSGTEVADAHKGVYQSVIRHVHGTIASSNTFSVDTLEGLMQTKKVISRTIH